MAFKHPPARWCHANRCACRVYGRRLFCPLHRDLLPEVLAARLREAHRPYASIVEAPRPFLSALADAVEAIAAAEGIDPANTYRRLAARPARAVTP